MANIILPPQWRLSERDTTPEAVYWQSVSRRSYLKLMGFGALALGGILPSCSVTVSEEEFAKNPKNYEMSETDRLIYPAERNSTFLLDRTMRAEHVAA